MAGSIVLVGMMGAGKTAVGSELARILGLPFADSDAEIERAAAMKITEIFARDGEEFFRARETQVLSRMLAGRQGILAVGGGAWVRPENRELISAAGVSVWLDVDSDTLWHRVRQRQSRPLLQTADPRGTLLSMLETRRPLYALADLTVSVGADDTVHATAERVRRTLTDLRPEVLSTDA
ncbi:MAG: shikimate kinase [Paracoccus denitrificans]|nr:MAG: shikimate kinase [Paracoccus denitrificans]PZO86031.1 MAG: shikimate kinase [Paracoccus denitrificans]